MSASVRRPARPKSTRPSRPSSRWRMLAGCGSPWKKAWRKIIVIQASVIVYASSRRASSSQVDRSRSRTCVPSSRSSVSSRFVVYRHQTRRHGNALVVAEVAAKCLRVARFLLVVELEPDRTGELVDELVRVDEVELPHTLADDAGGRAHQLEIRLDLTRRRRALHLDDDLGAVGQRRSVHLPDRSGRDRPLVEVEERPLDREPQLLVERPARRLPSGTARRRPGASGAP